MSVCVDDVETRHEIHLRFRRRGDLRIGRRTRAPDRRLRVTAGTAGHVEARPQPLLSAGDTARDGGHFLKSVSARVEELRFLHGQSRNPATGPWCPFAGAGIGLCIHDRGREHEAAGEHYDPCSDCSLLD